MDFRERKNKKRVRRARYDEDKRLTMKILHTMAGGKAGGAEMAFVDLLIAQKQAGMDIMAACRTNVQRVPLLKAVGVPVFEFPFGGIFDFKTKSGLEKLIRDTRPHIVQCWMSRAAKLTPNPSKTLAFKKIARLGGYYNLKYYKNVQHFIGNTPDICRWLIDDQKIPANHVSHINNFAELEPIKTPLTKAEFNTNTNSFVFLAMSRLHPAKAIDTALHALAKTPKAILWIAGEGPEEKKLKILAQDLNINDRVKWLGWRTDRAALLDASDAVLFTSRFEPFGGTFAQSWAAKKPLVTTASQGPMQYVTHGENALVANIDDADMLADLMLALMQDHILYRKLARQGYAAYQTQFKKKLVLKSYSDLYTFLMAT